MRIKKKKLNRKNNLRSKTKDVFLAISGGFSTSNSLLVSVNSVKDEVTRITLQTRYVLPQPALQQKANLNCSIFPRGREGEKEEGS